LQRLARAPTARCLFRPPPPLSCVAAPAPSSGLQRGQQLRPGSALRGSRVTVRGAVRAPSPPPPHTHTLTYPPCVPAWKCWVGCPCAPAPGKLTAPSFLNGAVRCDIDVRVVSWAAVFRIRLAPRPVKLGVMSHRSPSVQRLTNQWNQQQYARTTSADFLSKLYFEVGRATARLSARTPSPTSPSITTAAHAPPPHTHHHLHHHRRVHAPPPHTPTTAVLTPSLIP
jgi:hypothetical protein